MKKSLRLIAVLSAFCLLLCGCGPATKPEPDDFYTVGFGSVALAVPADSDQPLYIAGYHAGREITGVLDEQRASAVWLENGAASVLLISVDCVGLGSDTVATIRKRIAAVPELSRCDSVNVIATHTHAGIDTLGLWGPIGVDGKNDDFTQTLIDGVVQAAKTAYADRTAGTLTYSETETAFLQEDSRYPKQYDKNIYQLRFTPFDGEHNGIRIWSFAAHAEALRSENTQVSRDYPGAVCDLITQQTGEDTLYLPGAIGGLVMTPVLVDPFDAEANLQRTGERIATVAMLKPDRSRELAPSVKVSRITFDTQLENTLFQYYRFLGILQNDVRYTLFDGYRLQTELTVLQLGDVTLALLPGEVFPELVSGTGEDPALAELAAAAGIEDLVVIGLANDELGYILPPSVFVTDPALPYVHEAEGDHYEETNSVGPKVAVDLAEAFEKALKAIA